jgi:signal transduction histidine kinase
MAQLRPFVASQRLYERLLAPTSPPDVDVTPPFRALCEDILGARVAYLVPLGPLAPLVGPALVYPDEPDTRPPSLADIDDQFRSPHVLYLPLDPARYAGARWAVPLWSERGLIGALLLGEKRDGALYTQEEIEIARAGGERLIDTQASAEMARRLMALQRQRLVESQVLDRRARRLLHDEVLPQLHAAMLGLSSGERQPDSGSSDAVALLGDVHRQISDLLREMPATAAPEVARLGLIGALRGAVAEEFESAFDSIAWQIQPEAERVAGTLPPLTAEVLWYAAREGIRNAARYGRGGDPSRSLHLRIEVSGCGLSEKAGPGGLEVCIEDDGVGLRPERGTAGGSGQGLALHSTMMAVLGGSLIVESVPDANTRMILSLPAREDPKGFQNL